MFLNNVMKKNPQLIQAAVELHQQGAIPANTWIIDLDSIARNAAVIGDEAHKRGMTTYYMTKQINRNPFVVQLALNKGIDSTVAVDVMGAKMLHRYGIPVGHVGHLVQIPKHEIPAVLEMKPEMFTVYSMEITQAVNDAAQALNIIQPIVIKVAKEGNLLLPGQESGIYMHHLDAFIDQVQTLSHVKIIGVTAFPCVTYNVWGTEDAQATDNFVVLRDALAMLHAKGIDATAINAPGNTSTTTMDLLHEHGATHVEPGHGLTATTPEHIYRPELPEIPAMVYVSEISHHFDDAAYAYGGGLYICLAGGPSGYPPKALVGSSFDDCMNNKVSWHTIHRDNIDYYAVLTPRAQCQIHDTVIFGFRPQIFVTRAYVAAVSGISTGQPVVRGVFDQACNMLDEHYEVVPSAFVRSKVQQMIDDYHDFI